VVETLKTKNEEAYIGRKGEEILIDILSSERKVIECIEKLTGKRLGNVKVARGSHLSLWKTDVVLVGSTGERVGISLKTFKASARHDDHLDRRWLEESSGRAKPWSEVLEMPGEIVKIFREGILRMAAGESESLVPNRSDQQKIIKFLLEGEVIKRLLKEAFRNGEGNLLILALLEYNEDNGESKLCLFNLDEVIDFIVKDVREQGEKGITFSGSRIRIGRFIVLQRKSGNGEHVKIPKTDPRHPGNQLQVKFMTQDFRDVAINQIGGCCFDFPIGGCCFDFPKFPAKPTHKSLMNYLK